MADDNIQASPTVEQDQTKPARKKLVPKKPQTRLGTITNLKTGVTTDFPFRPISRDEF